MNPLMLQIDDDKAQDVAAVKKSDVRLGTLSDYVVAGMYEEFCQKFFQQSWVKPGQRKQEIFAIWAFASPFDLYRGKP